MSEDEAVKLRKQDALALAELIYDIYRDKLHEETSNS